jgi:branched-chain amino acid transport system permease protein
LETVREAALAAFVAGVLALPLIGLRVVHGPEDLEVRTRWEWLALAVVVVFAGRIALIVLARTWPALKAAGAQATTIGGLVRRHQRRLGIAALALAVAMPFMPFADRYVVDVATLVLIYVMLGWGLNIVVGLAGLLDLGYVALYAVGAYSFALLGTTFDLAFWVCLPLAGMFAASFGILLGYPVLRLRGDYLAIVTLGFGEIIRVVLTNWVEFSGGPNGIPGIPRPTLFGLEFTRRAESGRTFHEFFGLDYSGEHRIIFLYFIILAMALLTNAFVLRIRRLPLGRAWEALREDEIACRSLGINPVNVKLSAFALGATFGGFAGSFFATRSGFISPESFQFIESAIILSIVVLGGMGSQIGVVLAAAAIIVVPELLREFSEFRMLVFGTAMVLIMIWRPRGLLAHREPTIRLRPGTRS